MLSQGLHWEKSWETYKISWNFLAIFPSLAVLHCCIICLANVLVFHDLTTFTLSSKISCLFVWYEYHLHDSYNYYLATSYTGKNHGIFFGISCIFPQIFPFFFLKMGELFAHFEEINGKILENFKNFPQNFP